MDEGRAGAGDGEGGVAETGPLAGPLGSLEMSLDLGVVGEAMSLLNVRRRLWGEQGGQFQSADVSAPGREDETRADEGCSALAVGARPQLPDSAVARGGPSTPDLPTIDPNGSNETLTETGVRSGAVLVSCCLSRR